jgi:hypothetical protein
MPCTYLEVVGMVRVPFWHCRMCGDSAISPCPCDAAAITQNAYILMHNLSRTLEFPMHSSALPVFSMQRYGLHPCHHVIQPLDVLRAKLIRQCEGILA